MRFVLSFLIAVVLTMPLRAGGAERHRVSAEYRHDEIDYDEREKSYFREKLRVNLSRESRLGAAHLYVSDEKRHSATWYILLKDAGPGISLLGGNFMVSFGSGLFVGRQVYIPPDPFSSVKLKISEKVFRPVNSGNPRFSFHGGAFQTAGALGPVPIETAGFYSLRSRYSNFEKEGRYTSHSYGTITSSLEYREGRTASVNLHERGGVISFRPFEYFRGQIYGIQSILTSPDTEKVLWDCEEDAKGMTGISSMGNGGVFFMYGDEYISLFVDTGMAFQKTEKKDEEKYVRGRALQGGMNFRTRRLRFSLRGAGTAGYFYNPYGSEIRTPRRLFDLDFGLKVNRYMKGGVELYSSKALYPVASRKYLDVKKRETVYLEGKGKLFFGKTSLSRAATASAEEESHLLKVSCLGRFIPVSWFFLEGHTQVQKKEDIVSRGHGGSLTGKYRRHIKIVLRYSRFFINEKNYLYAKRLPGSRSIAPGFFVKEKCGIFAAALQLRFFSISVAGRFSIQHRGKKVLRKKAEYFASMKW